MRNPLPATLPVMILGQRTVALETEPPPNVENPANGGVFVYVRSNVHMCASVA